MFASSFARKTLVSSHILPTGTTQTKIVNQIRNYVSSHCRSLGLRLRNGFNKGINRSNDNYILNHMNAQVFSESGKASLIKPILFTVGVVSTTWVAADYYSYNKFQIKKKWKTFKKETLGFDTTSVHVRNNSFGDTVNEIISYYTNPNRFQVLSIVALNTAVFLMWKSPYNLRMMYKYFAHNVSSGRVSTMLTSAFSHIEGWHFLFNMVAFYSFGSLAQSITGKDYFLPTIITGAVCSSLFYHIQSYFGPRTFALGASGFVFTLVTLVALAYPDSQMLLFFVIPVKMEYGLYGAIAFDLIGLTGLYNRLFGWRLAHSAHLGGVVTGFAIYYLLNRRNRRKVASYVPADLMRSYEQLVRGK